jgi:hypothetical protein
VIIAKGRGGRAGEDGPKLSAIELAQRDAPTARVIFGNDGVGLIDLGQRRRPEARWCT